MMDRRLDLLPLLALAGTSLSGCVAVAIPALAGSAMLGTRIDGEGPDKPVTAASAPAPQVAAVAPRPAPTPVPSVVVSPAAAPPTAPAAAVAATAPVSAPAPVAPAPVASAPVRMAPAPAPAAAPAQPPARLVGPIDEPAPAVRVAPAAAPASVVRITTPPAPAPAPVAVPAPAPVAVPAPSAPVSMAAAAPAAAPVPPPAAPAAAAAPLAPRPEQLGFAQFVRYGRGVAAVSAGTSGPLSAMLADPIALDGQRKRCEAGVQPVAIIDLDPAGGLFAPPADPERDVPRALGLAVLRDAGVQIAWVSDLPVAEIGAVRNALEFAGLDVRGQDIVSLRRDPENRKQARKEALAATSCIIAIAGDAKPDFDERFQYLKNPEAGAALETAIGDGWFLIEPVFPAAK